MKPRQLDRELERKQVIAIELQPRQLLDPSEPLTQGVGMDEQRPRRLDHAPALGQVALERVEHRRPAPLVVVDQDFDGGAHPVARCVLRGDVHEVAVGTELRVADRAAVVQKLRRIAGDAAVITDPNDLIAFEYDGTIDRDDLDYIPARFHTGRVKGPTVSAWCRCRWSARVASVVQRNDLLRGRWRHAQSV